MDTHPPPREPVWHAAGLTAHSSLQMLPSATRDALVLLPLPRVSGVATPVSEDTHSASKRTSTLLPPPPRSCEISTTAFGSASAVATTGVPNNETKRVAIVAAKKYQRQEEDDDDDYTEYLRLLLRPKTARQMAELRRTRESVGVESLMERTRKRARLAKRKGCGNYSRSRGEIPFSDPRYHKTVSALVLSQSDIRHDLARMFGCGMSSVRARNSNGERDKKNCGACSIDCTRQENHEHNHHFHHEPQQMQCRKAEHQHQPHTNCCCSCIAHHGEGGGSISGSVISRDGLETGECRCGGSGSMSSSGSGGSSNNNRKAGRDGGGAERNPRTLFVKHRDKKGWVVCTICGVGVWPPNCMKHIAHCNDNRRRPRRSQLIPE